jgi:hypothetical protein
MKDPIPISLHDPDRLALENAYRSLPRTGEIVVETSLNGLASQLDELDEAGFAGMEIRTFESAGNRIKIRACKGKQGTCFNTGRTARYLGSALAALDDDHHLLIAGEETPVCEKSAILYSLPSYQKNIQCSDADVLLMEKLQTDPEIFDCDNFEAAQEKLYSLVRQKRPADTFTELFYPGPFKLLVLDDGTLVRRGRVNKVPVSLAGKLKKSDGLFGYDGQTGGKYESFTELYNADGPRCLLRKSPQQVISGSAPLKDLQALPAIPRDLRSRILQTIEEKRDYFILTGSNRDDEYGCCPSDEVTMADQLVRSGILAASREPATADGCPLTIYAFRNEIESMDGNLQFTRDQNFRDEVRGLLLKNNRKTEKLITRWVLFAFVAVTLILAVIRITGPSNPLDGGSLYTRFEVTRPNSTLLLLFHYSQRCEQCLAMEKYSREVLQDEFPAMMRNHQIVFREVVMDLPGNRDLIERFGLVTSTLVIIRFDHMKEDSVRVLNRSWALFDNEMEFKKMLLKELYQMTEEQK